MIDDKRLEEMAKEFAVYYDYDPGVQEAYLGA